MKRTRSKTIRLAMVRCDGHAYTFGPFLQKCDPVAFQRNFPAEYYKKMVLTRKPPVPYSTMLELIAIVEAAQIAQCQKRGVALKEVFR